MDPSNSRNLRDGSEADASLQSDRGRAGSEVGQLGLEVGPRQADLHGEARQHRVDESRFETVRGKSGGGQE